MKRAAYRITVVIRSPFLFEGLTTAGHGFDSSALRDEENHIIIPGDHLRGHLRHAIAAWKGEQSSEIKALFGSASPDVDPKIGGEQNKPERGAILLGDLKGPRAEDIGVYHRVKIDGGTGAAESGMLQLIELPAKIGEEVTFVGRLVLRPHKDFSAEAMRDLLEKALKLIPAMGALKSAGFGEVIRARCKIGPDTENVPNVIWPPEKRLQFDVTFDRPLLVDAARDASNSFTSSAIIPGGAIKGALAQALEDAGMPMAGNADFAKLAISHAFPLENDVKAGRALPLAILAATDGTDVKYACALPHDATVLQQLSDLAAPAFPNEWKSAITKAARLALGRPDADLPHFPRGRVAVGVDGLAEDAKLFVVETVGVKDRVWRFAIDTTKLPDDLLVAIKTQLAGGLDGLGRTGARMMLKTVVAAPALPKVENGETVLIMLETPGVLTDPTDGTAIDVQYQQYFSDLAGTKLLGHVARRGKAGAYYGYRFRGFGNAVYHPFEVTEAGAVFQLKVTDAGRFNERLKRGLPPVRIDAGRIRELDWSHCPYTAENGYGAISLINELSKIDQTLKSERRDAKRTGAAS